MAKSRSVGHLLTNTNTGLSQVITRAKELRKLTTRLKAMVDAPLNEHIYVANIRNTTLIIGTDSAAWHTRVKYLAPMILAQMRQLPDMDRLEKIEFRVQPFSAGLSDTPSSPQSERKNATADNTLDQRLQHLAKKVREKN